MMTYLPGSVLWVGAAIAPTHSFILVYCSIGFIVGENAAIAVPIKRKGER